jgi:hypothetical protein
LADLVDRVQEEIEGRLRELRPAIEEYRTLEEAQKALASNRVDRRRQAPASASGRRPAGARPRRKRATRAEAQRRRDRLVVMLRERPDARPAELAATLRMSNQNLYGLLRRLQADKVLRKTKSGYKVTRAPAGS